PGGSYITTGIGNSFYNCYTEDEQGPAWGAGSLFLGGDIGRIFPGQQGALQQQGLTLTYPGDTVNQGYTVSYGAIPGGDPRTIRNIVGTVHPLNYPWNELLDSDGTIEFKAGSGADFTYRIPGEGNGYTYGAPTTAGGGTVWIPYLAIGGLTPYGPTNGALVAQMHAGAPDIGQAGPGWLQFNDAPALGSPSFVIS